jgi:small subunit ribosomal protein S13
MRITGTVIPDNKRMPYALAYIYGVGLPTAVRILEKAKVDKNKKPPELSAEEIQRIKSILDKEYKTEGMLRREVQMNIKRLKDVQSYRGIRHTKGLPVRGQRTKTNARTRKGKRKTVGSGRKKVEKK